MILFSKHLLTMLVGVLMFPSYAVWASPQADLIPERPGSEQLLPETTVALMQVPNFREALEKLRETSAGRMWADESITPLVDGLWEEAETSYEDVKEKIDLEFTDLTSLPDGEITFVVIAPRRKNPEFLIMMELNEDDGVLDQVMERGRLLLTEEAPAVASAPLGDPDQELPSDDLEDAVDDVDAQPEFEEITPNEDGFDIQSFYTDGRKVYYFRHKSTVVACTSLSELNDLIDRWMGREVEKTRSLSANRKYVTIMNRCVGTNDLEPEFRFFVDPIAVAKSSTRGNASARFTINLLPLLGFDSLSAMGAALFLDEDDYESVVHGHVLLTNPRSGIFAMLAFKPTEYAAEEFVPKAATNHMMVSVDAPKAYAELTKIVDSFVETGYFEKLVEDNVNQPFGLDLKEDIIDAIDGRITWFQWIEEPAMINSTRSGIAIRLKDTEKFTLLMDKLTGLFNSGSKPKKAGENASETIEKRDYRDVTIYAEPRSKVDSRNESIKRRRSRNRKGSAKQRARMDVRIESPQMAIFGDCLVIAVDSDGLMKTMIDTFQGEGDRLADDDNYARIVEESQRLLNNELPMANFYSDPKRQIKLLMDVVNADQTKAVLGSAAEDNRYWSGLKRQLDQNPLPEFEQLEKYFTQSGGYMSDDDTGLHMLFFTLKPDEE